MTNRAPPRSIRSTRSAGPTAVVVGMTTAPSLMTASIDSQSSTWLPSMRITESPLVTPWRGQPARRPGRSGGPCCRRTTTAPTPAAARPPRGSIRPGASLPRAIGVEPVDRPVQPVAHVGPPELGHGGAVVTTPGQQLVAGRPEGVGRTASSPAYRRSCSVSERASASDVGVVVEGSTPIAVVSADSSAERRGSAPGLAGRSSSSWIRRSSSCVRSAASTVSKPARLTMRWARRLASSSMRRLMSCWTRSLRGIASEGLVRGCRRPTRCCSVPGAEHAVEQRSARS